MDDTQKNRCPKCGGVLGGTASGSITQWVTSCACGTTDTALDGQPDAADSAVMEICSTCKRRINRGRQGSFTQWVFRSDICDCEIPQPVLVSPESAFTHAQAASASAQRTSEEAGEKIPDEAILDVDPTRFPLERYSPLAILGAGSAGTVYLCHDRLLKKRVAIKTLSHLTQSDLVNFQREAKATSKLNHPNIVQILDFGATDSGVPFMVLEFVEGTNLASIIEDNGEIDIVTTLLIFGQVCDGLHEAHKNGIFHRDIKGTNILVSGFEQTADNSWQHEPPNLDVRIIDFGVAGFVQTTEGATTRQGEAPALKTTQGATIVGTPNFMAPDLAAGRRYDEKSEIYSLGCTIFNALTATTVFHADTALEILNLHASQPAPTLAETRPDLEFPPQLEKLVHRCLEKDPDARYGSVEELGTAIKDLLAAIEDGSDENPDEVTLFADDGDAKAAGSKTLQTTLIEKSEAKTTAIKSLTWVAALALVCVAGFTGYKHFIEKRDVATAPSSVSSPAGKFDSFASWQDDSEGAEKMSKLDLDGVPYLVSGPEPLADEDLKDAARVPDLQGIYIIGQRHPSATEKPFSGEGLKYFVGYPLDHLKIEGTPLSAEGFTAISKIKSLKHIYLGNIAIADEDLAKLSFLPDLAELDLANSKISSQAIASLSGFPALQTVSLVGMRNLTPESVAALSAAPHLRKLNVSCTTLGAQNLAPLQKFKNLEELRMNHSGVGDSSLAALANVPVRTLYLEENPIIGNGLHNFVSNKTLTAMTLRNCRALVPSMVHDLSRKMPNCRVTY